MNYALPYILLIGFYGFLACIRHNTEDKFTQAKIDLASIFLFIFFFGFRGFIMYDWSNYYPIFKTLPNFTTLFNTPLNRWEWEPAFELLAVLCHTITPDWSFFVLVCTLIDTTLLVLFFKQENINIPLGFVMYLSMNGFGLSTDLMRNSIAIFLFLNAIPYLRQRRPIPYFIICVIAAMFHSSAWTFFPLYFFLNRQINKWILFSLFILTVTIYVFHIPILRSIISLLVGELNDSMNNYIDQYLNMGQDTSTFGIGFIEKIFTASLTFIYIDKLRLLRLNSNIYINSLFLCITSFLLLSEFRTISMRVSTLFVYGYWIIWIDLIKCFNNQTNRKLYISFIAIYCLLKTYSSNTAAVNKYENVLLDSMNFTERLIFFRQHFFDK